MADILASFVNLIPVTLAQSLIIAFVVIGIMLPFRILNFPDLTSEGAYPMGGCIAGAMIAGGIHPLAAMIAAAACGFLAGCSTAIIHLRFRINTLLAGILVLTMLYSIDLRLMGRSNIALFTFPSLFKDMGGAHANEPWFKIALVGFIVALALGLLFLFFSTEKGAAMRAVGASPEMAEAQGISIWRETILGVGAASAFTAFGGALMVQSQGFADVNIGFGVLINGLAALIIGEALIGRGTVTRQLLAPLLGAVVFYQLLSLCLSLGLAPVDLKLATGLFVLLMLGLPALSRTGGGVLARERMRE